MARGSDSIPLPSGKQLVPWEEEEVGARQCRVRSQLGKGPHLPELPSHHLCYGDNGLCLAGSCEDKTQPSVCSIWYTVGAE